MSISEKISETLSYNLVIWKDRWELPFQLKMSDHQITNLHRSTSLSGQELLLDLIPIIGWNMLEKSRGRLSMFKVWVAGEILFPWRRHLIRSAFQSISIHVPWCWNVFLHHQQASLEVSTNSYAWKSPLLLDHPPQKEGQTQSSSSGGRSHACVQERVIPQNCKFQWRPAGVWILKSM